MKAIMISDKPKWCALMMNGDKTVEVRTSKALAKAIQKLIDENGYADIYVYCSKGKGSHDLASSNFNGKRIIAFSHKSNRKYDKLKQFNYTILNGKVIFKFRCYKVEEIETCERHSAELLDQSCLSADEFYDYLTKGRNSLGRVLGYAIHISDLEIFDKPKEISEFHRIVLVNKLEGYEKRLTKAPQNFCYVEVE